MPTDDQIRRRPAPGTLAAHFRSRIDALTSAVLVFPLFLAYQIGILTSGRGHNGADFVTRALIDLAQRDMMNYLLILSVMLVAYAAVLVILRRRGTFHPRAFVPVLWESTFYALTMGSLILFVISKFTGGMVGLAIGDIRAADVIVISAGAGFHEELIFRLGLMGGLGWLLAGITGKRRAWVFALVLSSLAFSLAHHIGPMGEPFTMGAFTYRALAGAFFALVYQLRGFAVAVWTHTLYDVYVFTLG